MCKNIGYTILFVLLFNNAKMQQLAFPGAEGAGAFVTGGRGSISNPTTVYVVTKLDDDNSVGTLRWACTNNSPVATSRTIVFNISGTIRLSSPLTLNRANTTIAGQTAPGDGICIADYPVTIGADNIILRYIRFRLGDRHQLARLGNDDALTGTGRNNIIVDHCTMSWSNDCLFDIYRGDNVTVQWCLLSEPLNFSYHDEGSGIEQHGYGGIWGGSKASFHHNIIAHCKSRMPRFDGSRNLGNGATAGLENTELINNIIYNWGDYQTTGGEGGNYNIINNYYKFGPNTPTNRRNIVLNPYKTTALPYGKYFFNGNYIDGVTNANTAWLGTVVMNGGSNNDTINSKVNTAFSISGKPIVIQTAVNAYTEVLKSAGAIMPKRDTLDDRIVRDIINRTGSIIDVQGGFPRLTPFNNTINAWPTLNTISGRVDTDNDGMPDSWEQKRGMPINDALNRNNISPNGYTVLENYLNGDSIVAIANTANTCIVGKAITTNANNNIWNDIKDTISSILNAVDTMHVIASIKSTTSFQLTASYFSTNTTRNYFGRPYANRNITLSTTTTLLSPVTVRLYLTVAEFNALKAADNSINTISDIRVLQLNTNNCNADIATIPSVITPIATGVWGTYGNAYYIDFTTNTLGTFYFGAANVATSINSIVNDKKVIVFPNPAKNMLTIQSSFNQPLQAIIYNAAGKQVQAIPSINNGNNVIPLKALPTGKYTVLFKSNNTNITKSIIIANN